jgi:two-component system, OmpR family, sensor kinase
MRQFSRPTGDEAEHKTIRSTGRGTTPRISYVRRLYLSFAALAALAMLLAGLGWHILQEAEYRVERGRIASDIYTALTGFSRDKAVLRYWSYRRILDLPATSQERTELIERLRHRVEGIGAKNEQARELDLARDKPVTEFEARAQTVSLLHELVAKLDGETRALLPDEPERAEDAALARIDEEFDQLAGRDLRALLGDSLEAESRALQLQRERADEGLQAARGLFIGAGGSGVLASLLLALWLVLRLRQPLRQLDIGLQAYGAGEFGYRFDAFRDAEFIRLGRQLNAMAGEVLENREREAKFRAQLEDAVALRTVDLRTALDELAASEEERQRLLADIGHELRTPITVIRGEAQVALRAADAPSEHYREALGRIIDVTRQMGRLIEDLLVLVREPGGKPTVHPRDIPLNQALGPALDIGAQLAAQHGIRLIVEAGGDAGTFGGINVHADPERLQQVLCCMLDNAIRYSRPGGEVRLAVEGNDDEVTLRISDDGIGIASEDLPHIFTRGWRASAARDHRPDGLGLGLAIARQLALAQSARLAIEPRPGGGVAATLRLARPFEAVTGAETARGTQAS